MDFALKEIGQTLLVVFSLTILGYLVGSIRIKGISLGTAAVFLSALLFGYLGYDVPPVLQTLGLVLFTTAVGMSAGPGFFQRMKQSGVAYLILCLTIAATGAVLCTVFIKVFGVETPLVVGIMAGSFTTSPGFAAAKEVAGTGAAVVAAGYGIAYPIGVVGKVLSVQLIPRMLHADMEKEREKIRLPEKSAKEEKPCKRLDSWGMSSFSLAIVLGVLLGAVTFKLPGGGHFSLGTSGGPLVAGLLIGALGRIGSIDLKPNPKLYGPMKEFGLIMFYAGAGVEGGHGIAAILSAYGFSLLFYGLALVVVPVIVGTFVFLKVLKIPLLNGLGSLSASMTSTPSLAVLIETAGTDDVAAAYATTYPIALVTLVLLVQALMTL